MNRCAGWFSRGLAALVAWGVAGNAGGEEPPQVERLGELRHERLAEASGLVASPSRAGVFWCLTDSGGPPHLFAVAAGGSPLAEFRVAEAINVDWETLAADENGRLLVGDTGNNAVPGGVKLRWIYRLPEPALPAEPHRPDLPEAELPAVKLQATIRYTFPEEPFDVEALVALDGAGYLVRKEKSAAARVYRLPLELPEGDPDAVATLEEAGSLHGVEQVTGADLSADGLRLAVCGTHYAALYERTAEEPPPALFDGRRDPRIVRLESRQVEGCAWDSERLLLVDEDRSVYAVRF
jgi:hypothetical protein